MHDFGIDLTVKRVKIEFALLENEVESINQGFSA